ncbi:MAG: DUF6390 family protein [Acidimicrobiia bacterium]|nr:DUF6390 family protein [Acidimicrobiia bacterium]
MKSGPDLFARFAAPPNRLGYCGPGDAVALAEAADAGAASEIRHLAGEFAGAMPYLRLIAAEGGYDDPLHHDVVAAYWLGGALLDRVGAPELVASVGDRFVDRAGPGREQLRIMAAAGRPSHAFHVFCVYPWVGMLRAGFTVQPLHVLDECRVSWGTVVDPNGIVEGRPLTYKEPFLGFGDLTLRRVTVPPGLRPLNAGDTVAVHWSTVAAVLDDRDVAALRVQTDLHVRLVNRLSRGVVRAMEHA